MNFVPQIQATATAAVVAGISVVFVSVPEGFQQLIMVLQQMQHCHVFGLIKSSAIRLEVRPDVFKFQTHILC